MTIDKLLTPREAWLKAEVASIKAGATIRQRCTMATEDRLVLGLCLGDIPEDRAHRGLDCCSPECRADKKRLRRWETSKHKCRSCGHGLSKKERAEIAMDRQARLIGIRRQPGAESTVESFEKAEA